MKKRIVIISDCSDVAYNEIRATILRELDKSNVKNVEIEPLVKAEEFSIINGAFLTRLMAEIYNPENIIFLVILNPLKTTRKDRARIMGETKNGFKFVGANTGTLNWLIKDFGLKYLYEFSKEGLSGKKFVSFGGKYFHAPMAAKVAMGISFKKLGIKRDKGFLSDFRIRDGTVVHIDNFGVPKIKGKLSKFKEKEEIDVYVNGKKKVRATFTNSMKDLRDGTWAVYPGSSLNNLPEIGKVRCLGSASRLGIKIGDKIEFG